MRTLSIVPILIVASCSSPPSHLLGPLPADAVEILGALCAHSHQGLVEPDDDFATAKSATYDKAFPPGLEAVRCVPEHGPDPKIDTLVFDRETQRLYKIRAVVVHGDLELLDRLVLPALPKREQAGYALEKMRLNAPWMNIDDTDHFWTHGHTVIWMHWVDVDYKAWPPTSEAKFQVGIYTKK